MTQDELIQAAKEICERYGKYTGAVLCVASAISTAVLIAGSQGEESQKAS